MSEDRQVKVGRRSVTLSRPDKLIFPEDRITKSGLLDHYLAVADLLLPHLRERPLSLQRFPDGIDESGFYQKKAADHFPDWIASAEVAVKGTGGRQRQTVCNDQATLAFLVDQAVITPHPWLARTGHLDHPDVMIFDLDPPGADFGIVRDAARALADCLREIGLLPYVMTTGSRGLHVRVPLDGRDDFDAVRDLAQRVCDLVARRRSDRFTTGIRKDARRGRLFLDYLRNSYGQTAVPPFAVRPIPGAPVAVTLDWEELGDRTLGPQRYRLKNVRRRLGQKEDPWRNFARHPRSAAKAARALDELVHEEL
jgi:bifunctional non-homologous end joining protein LigD